MGTRRPGTDVMRKLGDCSKLKLQEIDLISRTMKCEIEIFHFDDKLSFTSSQNVDNEEEMEEEEIPIPTTESATDDENRINQMVNNLDCLIRRIEEMQLCVLKRKEQQESSESSVTDNLDNKNDKLILRCKEKEQICKLLHDHNILQCRMDNLIYCYQKFRNALNKTNSLMSLIERETYRIQNIGKEYKEWAEQAIHELSICSERHKYLEKKMITKNEKNVVVKSHSSSAIKRCQKCLNKRLIDHQLLLFHKEIEELLQFGQDLRTEMEKRLTKIDKLAKSMNNSTATSRE